MDIITAVSKVRALLLKASNDAAKASNDAISAKNSISAVYASIDDANELIDTIVELLGSVEEQYSSKQDSNKSATRDETIVESFSQNEHDLMNLLKSTYPGFTTAKMMFDEGVIANTSAASAIITRLRRKSIAIESAKQARENDPTITDKTIGFRLIKHRP